MSDRTITIQSNPGNHELHHYQVRDGFAWANIYVRTAKIKDEGNRCRTLIEVVSNSDYGVFGFCWGYASGDWRVWLSDLDFHYAMGKMAMGRFQQPMSIESCIENARRIIRERRADGGMSAGDGHKLRDVLYRHVFEWGAEAFLRELDEETGGLVVHHQLYDHRWEEVSPQARGFWDRIWVPFAASLTEAVAADAVAA